MATLIPIRRFSLIMSRINMGYKENIKMYEQILKRRVPKRIHVYEGTPEYIRIGRERLLIADFSIRQLPSCCGALFMNDLNIYEVSLTVPIHNTITMGCSRAGYTRLYYITAEHQTVLIDTFDRFGWNILEKFINKNTGKELTTWSYDLRR